MMRLLLGLVVVEFAGSSTLGARPSGQVLMGQIDVHFFGDQLQVHGSHAPGALDAQDAAVKLTAFHGDWMGYTPYGCIAPAPPGGCTRGGSAERFETPLVGGAARSWRLGGNPPTPAFPRRGQRGRGRVKFRAPHAN